MVALVRTADLVRRALTAIVEAKGITLQQYNVLRILRGAGRRACPPWRSASAWSSTRPGVTRLLDRLQAKDLVRRQRCPEDRRQIRCWIKPAGARLLAELESPMRGRIARRRMAGLGPGGLESR